MNKEIYRQSNKQTIYRRSNKISQFIKYLKNKNLSPHTINNYPVAIRQFNQKLTTNNIIKHIKQVKSRYEPSSLRKKIISLSAYAKYKKVKIAWEKITRIIPKVQRKFFATINERELNQLKQARFEESNLIYERNNLILDYLFYLGLRVGELTNLKHGDYCNGLLRVLGKGQKIRHIFLPEFLVNTINAYSSDYLFVNSRSGQLSTRIIERIVVKRTRLAGIKKRITPHTFRRSFATLLDKKGARLTTIQKLLGHSNITTTAQYIHNDYETLYADYSKLWEGGNELTTNYAY